MSFLKKISNLFAPEVKSGVDGEQPSDIEAMDGGMVTASMLLQAVFNHFKLTAKRLSTKYNLLYHTSFTIYLKAANYNEISESLPFIATGLERMLVEEINRLRKDYPGYRPHSELWQFQLVEIPEDAEIEGMSQDDLDQDIVIEIQSELFPPSEEAETRPASSGRIVTTARGVNSLRAIRRCINPEIISKLHLIERDRIQLALTLDPNGRNNQASKGFGRAIPHQGDHSASYSQSGISSDSQWGGSSSQSAKPAYKATLVAQDGTFLDGAGGQPIHTVAMTADELHIAGRSAMPGQPGIEVIRTDSDRILTPHVKIRFDRPSGQFFIAAIGPTTLNQRTLTPDPDRWVRLSRKSIIILDNEVQIEFKAQ